MSDKAPAAPPAARCPLGFTGTPPAGHPVLPGMASTSSASTTSSSTASTKSGLSLLLSPSFWSPTTLLVVDGVFLLLCVVVAVYLPQIKTVLFGSGAAGGAAGSAGVAGAGAGAPKVVNGSGKGGPAVVGGSNVAK